MRPEPPKPREVAHTARAPARSLNNAHLLSVDVEDYFQVEAFADVVAPDEWPLYPSRVVANTEHVLEVLAARNVKGTFFFVGWIAHRFPALLRKVAAAGHEVACHSYWHRPVYRLNSREFREDTRWAKSVIEQGAGVRVLGYRAPTWSITRDSAWALDILHEEGFHYDSSIFPVRHDLYGIPGAQRFAYIHTCTDLEHLQEFPPATIRLLGATLPAAGGGYLRLLPMWYHHLAFRQAEHRNERVLVYFHPWEIDVDQPRINGRWKSRFRHYNNLDKMAGRLTELFHRYKFQRICDLLPESQSCPSFPEVASA